MRLLFCADPLNPRQPDSDYAGEVAAAEALGIPWSLLHYEALVQENSPTRAVRFVPEAAEVGVYRGWMLRAEEYAALYAALEGRGVRLINSPEAYRHTHHFPEAYPLIEGRTPRSVWLAREDLAPDAIHAALQPFGDSPLVLKDWVKSRKHEWIEACYIPSASDREAVARVVRRFLDLQGPDLQGGLVFREFLPLQSIGAHSRSGMPLTREHRLIFLDGEPLLSARYWDEGEYRDEAPPLGPFVTVARTIQSRFFTMDVARRADGEWVIIELGDAQVAGLPEAVDRTAFYSGLRDRLPA